MFIVGEEQEVSIADVATFIVEAMDFKGEIIVRNVITLKLNHCNHVIKLLQYSLIQVNLMVSLRRQPTMQN